MVDHRLLHRMQLVVAREVLDRDDLGAVGLAGEQDAGIDRLVDEALAAQPPQHHRAGAAIALGAALLGAGRALGQAQIVEQRQRRRKARAASPSCRAGGNGPRCASAAPIGRIGERRDQQRHVVVRVLGDAEAQRHDDRGTADRAVRRRAAKIVADMERDFVVPGRESRTFEQRPVDPAVRVGDGLGDRPRASPSSRVRTTFSPAAGFPAAVSSTCVVIRPIRRNSAGANRRQVACSNKRRRTKGVKFGQAMQANAAAVVPGRAPAARVACAPGRLRTDG